MEELLNYLLGEYWILWMMPITFIFTTIVSKIFNNKRTWGSIILNILLSIFWPANFLIVFFFLFFGLLGLVCLIIEYLNDNFNPPKWL